MSGRTFDPEETRRVGTESVPKLAADYQRAVAIAYQAGSERDGAISPELHADFDAYFKLMYNACYETAENLDRLGPALVAIADDDDLTEGEITKELEEAATETQTDFAEEGYIHISEGDTVTDFDQAPNSYEDQLTGRGSPEEDEQ
ncbi:hypothetical protein L0U85_19230 [Glycomyces sp. L485]|uniref:hypothetical protein n=1 Tax=Glycomyces sp. L485 TaxID=2909235 RepID=UPI001F4B70D6|nr:hypothetical protein [Glycomyces sp. L485]MCH7232969.1 hypothetical protein [Glycomyces sp. L485]